MKLLAKKLHVICYCDFCGKTDREVRMIDGQHAFICSECVEAAFAIIRPELSLVK